MVKKNINEINPDAKNINEITLKDAYSWYSNEFYKSFNAHDIEYAKIINKNFLNELNNRNLKGIPIKEIDVDDLEYLINSYTTKMIEGPIYEQGNLSNVVSIKDVETFFEAAIEEICDILNSYKTRNK